MLPDKLGNGNMKHATLFLAAAALISAFFYPVWTGMEIPYPFWVLHNWLSTWV